MPGFYLCCLCYVGVRAYNNVFNCLSPFYLIDVLKLGSESSLGISFNLALVPLLLFASASVSSGALNWVYNKIGRKKALLIGSIIGVASMAATYTLTAEHSWVIYCLAVVIGISNALLLNTAINLISEVVGGKGSKGAFVFGVYSFIDKSTVGLLVYFLSNSEAYSNTADVTSEMVEFIRLTYTAIPGICCALGTLSMIFYPIPEYKNK